MTILDIFKTSTTPANFVFDLIREIFHGWFNRLGFFLLAMSYELFFNVASAELLQSATIRNFYGRVQLILGVFMVFRLSIVALKGIVNPDSMQKGDSSFSAVIKKVVIGLLMLAVITPLNIPNASNNFEKEVNNNGILFGTLYSLQSRILKQNTLGRIVLGSTDNSKEKVEQDLKYSSQIFISTIAKAFVSFNLKEGKSDETKAKNRMCNISDQSVIDKYTDLYSGTYLYNTEYITLACNDVDNSGVPLASNMIRSIKGENRYVFNYILFVPFAVSLVFAFVLLGYSVDIAIRAIKLAILRLIAPIPIIAYMGPDSKENQAFSNWCKALLQTYLDIFIRLIIVYFVLFIIIDIIKNGIVIDNFGPFSFIIICLGLFLFAKQAPKYIANVLGIKDTSLTNIGLSGLMSGLGTLKAGGLNAGSFAKAGSNMLKAMSDASDAAANGKAFSPTENGYAGFRDATLQQLTGDKNRRGGLLGYLDHRSDIALGKSIGASDSVYKKAKSNWMEAEARADRATKDYEGYQQFAANNGVTLENGREAWNDNKTFKGLTSTREALEAKFKGAKDAKEQQRIQEEIDKNNKAIDQFKADVKKKYGIDASTVDDKHLGGKILETVRDHNLDGNDEKFKQYIILNTKYDTMSDAQGEAEKYKKNASDIKEAIGHIYGKELPATAKDPLTPDVEHSSKAGEGGNIWSGQGVNK
ncbi:MAG: hypothetical protein IJI43_04485 [Bacilli bacterium]|nr:hypothetical protein [Bacilli bacterium]